MRARARARARSRARARAPKRRMEGALPRPLAEEECLDFAGRKGLAAWDLMRFLYDCIKRAREREEG